MIYIAITLTLSRPVASQIGAYGGDLGIELGFIFASISYVVLRGFELKKLGR